MNIAVILAAGKGVRAGGELPKQFVRIGEKMVIEYAIQTFQNHPMIDEIAVVTSADYLPLMQQLISTNRYSKLRQLIRGGAERYQSSWAAVRHYADSQQAILLIHDAARPFVTADTITKSIQALGTSNCALVAVPATDTVVYSADNRYITNVPPRKQMYYAQTPQVFRLATLKKAFEKGLQDPQFNPTDDSSVILKYLPEESIVIVEGRPSNRKITYAEDLLWATQVIQCQPCAS